MKLKHFLFLVLLMVVSMAQAQMEMPPVPVDPEVRIGKLDNGLTYFIRHNNWPEHRANFYIAQKVGSIQEEESQRGLAHFLEHMAFNGSDNFKGNDLIRYCESIGVQFGRDLNAYTSIDQTVYNIDNVPTTRFGAVDSCLLILRDWADGLTLDPEEIDKERGVIHEEWRLRTSASSRMFERNLPALYPGSKYGVRYPIGLMSVVDNFSPKELRDYYEKWYHPTNQGIIVVGDVDVDAVEAKIKELFGPIQNPDPQIPVVDEQVPDTDEPIVIVDKDKEQETSEIDIMFKHDPFPAEMKQTMAYTLTEFLIHAGTRMLNQRLQEIGQKPECPYTSAYAYDGQYIYAKTKDAFSISVTPKDLTQSEAAVKAVITEVKRAAQHGFTATEYNRFKADCEAQLDRQMENKDKRYNTQFYNQILGYFLEGEPMPSLEWTYTTMKQMLPMLPVEAVNQTFAQLIPQDNKNLVIINFNNEAEGNVYPTAEGLLAALNEAKAAEVEAFVDNVKDEPLITKLPKAGKIKSEKKSDKFDYTIVELSNGVKVRLKKTDLKKDQVMISGRGDGGESLYGESDFVNLQVFGSVIDESGLGNFSNTELQKALAGKTANASLSMSEKYTNIGGTSTPKDVETLLQLIYLYFTNINKDQQSVDKYLSSMEVQLKNRDLTPETALSDTLTATLYNHSARRAPLTVESLPKVNYDRILQIAKERTASAKGWEFTIIGNFDEATIRPLICQYLGALPAKKANAKGEILSKMAEGQIENIFTRKMETPKANGYMIWHNEALPYTLENSIKVDMIGQILSMIYLKKIREDASAAYSCGAMGQASFDPDYTMFMILAYCPMKPEMKDVALKIMSEEVPALVNDIDEDKLTKVKEYMIKNIDDERKVNGYWSGVINTWDRYGIDEDTDYKAIVEAQTADSLKAFMKEFLAKHSKITVCMLPEE